MFDRYLDTLRYPAEVQQVANDFNQILNDLYSNLYRLNSIGVIKLTEDGGIAQQFINGTGSDTIKGTVVQLSSTQDKTIEIANNSYVVQGIILDSGIPDGGTCWVVTGQRAKVLLEDGTSSPLNGWMRLSTTVPGRAIIQDFPGVEFHPASVSYTQGANSSGTLSDLITNGGNYYVMSETGSTTPGLDVVFTLNPTKAMSKLDMAGYYEGSHISGVDIYVWNYNTTSWDLVTNWPNNGTVDIVTSYDLTADHFGANESLVRFVHSDTGDALHLINIDHLSISLVTNTEHFKEIGHSLEKLAPGTDVLVTTNLHIL